MFGHGQPSAYGGVDFPFIRITSFLVLFSFFYLPSVSAATLTLHTAKPQYPVGEQFIVDIELDANNASNQDIVLADAVIQYETEMLELLGIDTGTAASDFSYTYNLVENSFPIAVNELPAAPGSGQVVPGIAQIVVGVPGASALSHTSSNARVAQLIFKTKEPPLARSDKSTQIALIFDGGPHYTRSKVIANDGNGTDVLTQVNGASIQVGFAEQVPIPIWSYGLLALSLLAIGFSVYPRERNFGARAGSAALFLTTLLTSFIHSSDATAQNHDLNGDNVVDSHDIGALLSRYNSADVNADLDNSGNVDDIDLDLILSQFNPASTLPPPQPRNHDNTTAYSFTYYDTEKSQVESETVDGPRADVEDTTVTRYDTEGNISEIFNALGHVTLMQNYNARGQVNQVIDANGVVTALTYHPRGWLTSQTVQHPVDPGQDATIALAYDAIGQLTEISLPDDSLLKYEYDDARRLVAVENSLAERIEYTLDNAGNRVAEVICGTGTGGSTGTSCDIRKTQARIFDALGRLRKDIGAQSQTYRYDYDKSDNPETQTDAKNHSTTQIFDALDRLVEQIEPDDTPGTNSDNPKVQYSYDSEDRVKSVTDQRGLVTTYNYDAFGSMISVDSPDTGLTTYTYDDAGNRTSKTDARGQVVYYQYDALNRLTHIAAINSPSENVSYLYDDTGNGSYGIGRLSHIIDVSGKTSFVYDHRGNVVQKTVAINAVSGDQTVQQIYTTSYTYTLADRLQSITYPSGRQLVYTRDADGRIVSVSNNGTILVSNINYQPFGPVSAYELGNGISRNTTFDTDYRVTDIVDLGSTTKLDLDYGYDINNNINDLDDLLAPVNDQAFSYDELDRLDTASGGYGSIDYNYDLAGNRAQKTHSESGTTTSDSYIYPLESHRLSSINRIVTDGAGTTNSTRQLLYNDAGNTVQDTRFSGDVFNLVYNALNRFNGLGINGSPAAAYNHNALGQRVTKTTLTSELHYHYDESGRLLALSNENGQLIKEYLYVDGMRIARIVNDSGSMEAEYFHNDHLGRPLVLSNATQDIVWQANYLPFGEVHVVVNTTLDQELGFPGQILDQESGFWYNYFRDYDATAGRYLQSDPTGLFGGLNTYGYALQNPARYFDPNGETPVTAFTGAVVGAIGGAVGAGIGTAISGRGFGASLSAAGTGFWQGAIIGGAAGACGGCVGGVITGLGIDGLLAGYNVFDAIGGDNSNSERDGCE